MNYKKHYEKLIHKARNRSILKSEYYEVHHIIPKCIGGDDSKDNLIPLFPEEHLVTHLLLVKMHPTNDKLSFAAFGMVNGFNKHLIYSNKDYGWFKRTYSKMKSD